MKVVVVVTDEPEACSNEVNRLSHQSTSAAGSLVFPVNVGSGDVVTGLGVVVFPTIMMTIRSPHPLIVTTS